MLHIAETPGAVVVSRHLRAALERIAPRLGQAIAMISGRPIAELDRLFAPLKLPSAGLHGLERRDARGRLHRLGEAAGLDALRGPLHDFAAANPGVLLEDKGRALALHYRGAPQLEARARRLVEDLTAERADRLRVLHGRMVVEIKPCLADKGAAIAAFMTEPPFAGRTPVFLGDDVTDEDGFRVVNELGGISIRIGDGAATSARYRLADVDTVLAWLADLPERLDAATCGERA